MTNFVKINETFFNLDSIKSISPSREGNDYVSITFIGEKEPETYKIPYSKFADLLDKEEQGSL